MSSRLLPGRSNSPSVSSSALRCPLLFGMLTEDWWIEFGLVPWYLTLCSAGEIPVALLSPVVLPDPLPEVDEGTSELEYALTRPPVPGAGILGFAPIFLVSGVRLHLLLSNQTSQSWEKYMWIIGYPAWSVAAKETRQLKNQTQRWQQSKSDNE